MYTKPVLVSLWLIIEHTYKQEIHAGILKSCHLRQDNRFTSKERKKNVIRLYINIMKCILLVKEVKAVNGIFVLK